MTLAPTASHIYLQNLVSEPPTILAFLSQHFPQIGEKRWSRRMREGKVHIGSIPVDARTPYQPGMVVSYFREIEAERLIPFAEEIIFQNDHLLVVDKPHFLPVTPAGDCVNECLLYRLQRRTGIRDLAPLHRLDRDTAGLVLFSTAMATRGTYHQLFANQEIEKTYLAVSKVVAGTAPNPPRQWLLENRLERGTPWFTMEVVEGPPNARTEIRLQEVRGQLALFGLRPHTGKKHQLRLHLASIGFPILNDNTYPYFRPRESYDYSQPLQLLAAKIAFQDPITGAHLRFSSKQQLSCWNS